MSIFKTRKQNQEYLISPSEIEKIRLLLENIDEHFITLSIPQPENSNLPTLREMKHLKRLMWKNARRP